MSTPPPVFPAAASSREALSQSSTTAAVRRPLQLSTVHSNGRGGAGTHSAAPTPDATKKMTRASPLPRVASLSPVPRPSSSASAPCLSPFVRPLKENTAEAITERTARCGVSEAVGKFPASDPKAGVVLKKTQSFPRVSPLPVAASSCSPRPTVSSVRSVGCTKVGPVEPLRRGSMLSAAAPLPLQPHSLLHASKPAVIVTPLQITAHSLSPPPQPSSHHQEALTWSSFVQSIAAPVDGGKLLAPAASRSAAAASGPPRAAAVLAITTTSLTRPPSHSQSPQLQSSAVTATTNSDGKAASRGTSASPLPLAPRHNQRVSNPSSTAKTKAALSLDGNDSAADGTATATIMTGSHQQPSAAAAAAWQKSKSPSWNPAASLLSPQPPIIRLASNPPLPPPPPASERQPPRELPFVLSLSPTAVNASQQIDGVVVDLSCIVSDSGGGDDKSEVLRLSDTAGGGGDAATRETAAPLLSFSSPTTRPAAPPSSAMPPTPPPATAAPTASVLLSSIRVSSVSRPSLVAAGAEPTPMAPPPPPNTPATLRAASADDGSASAASLPEGAAASPTHCLFPPTLLCARDEAVGGNCRGGSHGETPNVGMTRETTEPAAAGTAAGTGGIVAAVAGWIRRSLSRHSSSDGASPRDAGHADDAVSGHLDSPADCSDFQQVRPLPASSALEEAPNGDTAVHCCMLYPPTGRVSAFTTFGTLTEPTPRRRAGRASVVVIHTPGSEERATARNALEAAEARAREFLAAAAVADASESGAFEARAESLRAHWAACQRQPPAAACPQSHFLIPNARTPVAVAPVAPLAEKSASRSAPRSSAKRERGGDHGTPASKKPRFEDPCALQLQLTPKTPLVAALLSPPGAVMSDPQLTTPLAAPSSLAPPTAASMPSPHRRHAAASNQAATLPTVVAPPCCASPLTAAVAPLGGQLLSPAPMAQLQQPSTTIVRDSLEMFVGPASESPAVRTPMPAAAAAAAPDGSSGALAPAKAVPREVKIVAEALEALRGAGLERAVTVAGLTAFLCYYGALQTTEAGSVNDSVGTARSSSKGDGPRKPQLLALARAVATKLRIRAIPTASHEPLRCTSFAAPSPLLPPLGREREEHQGEEDENCDDGQIAAKRTGVSRGASTMTGTKAPPRKRARSEGDGAAGSSPVADGGKKSLDATPNETWTNEAIAHWAKRHGVDLGHSRRKAEMLEVIARAAM